MSDITWPVSALLIVCAVCWTMLIVAQIIAERRP